MLQKGQTYDKLSPLVLVFVCAFDLFGEGRYVYTFKSRCLENLDLELANDVTTMFLNANGVAGDVTPQMVNFLEYVKTQVPNDAYTRELEAEVARLKLDKEVRRKYMVLQAELRDTEIIAFEAGEAKKSRETALKMLRKQKPLSEIMEFASLTEEDIRKLAKENGLEVVV